MNRILYLLCFILPFAAHAQKQGNVWRFGTQLGLDFNSGAPVYISGGMTGTLNGMPVGQHGCSNICDANGKLLFYTDNTRLWNAGHKVMPNGDSLSGDRRSLQGSIIVPKPGSSNVFYVFISGSHFRYAYQQTMLSYTYTIVDMCLDSSRGDVLESRKNILMTDSATEKLCVTRDDQGGGYWIAGHKAMSNQIWVWRLTASGLSAPVISTISKTYNHNHTSLLGKMKFSSSGKKLAITVVDTARSGCLLYDFNLATGRLSNECRITVDSPAKFSDAEDVEFSPDDSKLYITFEGKVDGNNVPVTAKRLLQYDLSAGSCALIRTSMETLWSLLNPYHSLVSGMQLGPDGKIYVATGSVRPRIGRINFPNLSGTAAQFDTAFMLLPASNYVFMSFPGIIAGYKYHNGIPCPKPSSVELTGGQSRIELTPNPVRRVATLKISPSLDVQGMRILIADASGRITREMPVSRHEQSIDMIGAAPGLYFYHVYQHGLRIKAGKVAVE